MEKDWKQSLGYFESKGWGFVLFPSSDKPTSSFKKFSKLQKQPIYMHIDAIVSMVRTWTGMFDECADQLRCAE